MRTTTMQERGESWKKKKEEKEWCKEEEEKEEERFDQESGDTHRNLIPRSHCPSPQPGLLDIQCLHSGPNFTNSLSRQKVIQ